MRTLFCICFVSFLASALVGYPDVQGAQVRHVNASNTPITALIKPGEDALVIESRESGPLEVAPPEGTSTIEWMFHISSAVLLVAVDDVRPQLTRKEDWIISRAEGSVLEILKLPDWLAMKVGERISFENDGGELVVDGVRVTARVPWARPLEPLKRYVVFAGVDKATKAFGIGPTGLYEVSEDSGRLRRVATTTRPNGIEQASGGEVLTTLRQLAARPR